MENIEDKPFEEGCEHTDIVHQICLDEDNYRREALLYLAKIKTISDDVMDSNFSNSKLTYHKVLFYQATLEISYSCSVGYHRVITKQEWDYANKCNKEVTEVVTDWFPHSNTTQGDYESDFIISNLIDDKEEKYIMEEYKDFRTQIEGDNTNNLETNPTNAARTCLKKEDVDKGFDICVNSIVCDARNSLPGDTYKDFTYSVRTVGGQYVKIFSFPKYTIDFDFDNSNYYISGIVTKKHPELYGDIPNCDKKARKKADSQTKKPAKVSLIVESISILFAMLLFMLTTMTEISININKQTFMLIIVILMLTSSITMYITYEIFYAKAKKRVYKSIWKVKYQKLCDLFKNNNYRELDELDKKYFESKFDDIEDENDTTFDEKIEDFIENKK